MSLRTRLLAAFLVVVAVLALPAGFAALRLTELQSLAVEERGRHAAASLSLGRFQAALAEFDLRLRSHVAAPGPGAGERVDIALSNLEREVSFLERSGYGDAAGPLAGTVEALAASTEQLRVLVDEERLSEATDAFGRIQPLLQRATAQLGDAASSVDRRAQEDFDRAHEISLRARRGTLLALGFGLAVAGLVVTWAAGAVTAPIRRLARATGAVSDGHLRAPDDLPYDRRDEIGELSRSFRSMTRRLEELHRMKAEFVGVVSHELKTPINVIRGYTELIEEELASDVTEHQREILRGIADQVRAMSRLVGRLMDISRLETGEYHLELERVHVEDVVVGLERAFDLVADRSGVDLRTRIDESAPETMVLDVDLVRDEVLGNLVSNAVKFTPEGGEVRLEVRGESGRVVFRVEDTGPGIPEEHREHVFDKYYQVQRSRKMGSGLGLAIAREMAEAHGGTIQLLPSAAEGAAFEVVLPLRPPGAVEREPDVDAFRPAAVHSFDAS